jgi:hypothetical protein
MLLVNFYNIKFHENQLIFCSGVVYTGGGGEEGERKRETETETDKQTNKVYVIANAQK